MTGPYQVAYVDRRGAGVVRSFGDQAATLRCLARLRRPATVRDADGEVVGRVEHCDYADDRRIRWLWWMWPEDDT